jgi:hypothetical protein
MDWNETAKKENFRLFNKHQIADFLCPVLIRGQKFGTSMKLTDEF